MNRRHLKIHICLVVCFMLGGGFAEGPRPASAAARTLASDPELDQLLRGVENKYNRIKSLRMHFRQTYEEGGQVMREEAGTLYLRKPNQMRWEYENPEPKLFLTDGKQVMLYVPQEKRVTETEVKNSDDLRNPMRFLLGGLKFKKEFQSIEKSRDVAPLDRADVVIQAVPNTMREQLELVVMEITPQFEIRRLILKQPGGIETDFRFEDAKPDLPLSPELFRLTPPPGAEVVHQ